MSDSSSKTTMITCGIDMGGESTKVVLGPSLACELVRNEVGGHTTPTAVSWQGQLRHIGHAANRKAKSAVVHWNRLFPGEVASEPEEEDALAAFDRFGSNDKDKMIQVTLDDGTTREFHPAAMTAMLLGKIRQNVLATVQRVSPSSNNSDATTDHEDIHYVLTVAPNASPSCQAQLLAAAQAAGMVQTSLVTTSQSYALNYQRKFPHFATDAAAHTILIVDMGHTQTTVSVVQFGGGDNSANDDDTKESNDNDNAAAAAAAPPPQHKILSAVRHASLGARSIDVQLWKHFQSTMPSLKHATPVSRAGWRLLEGCQKLKHLLSQLPEATVTVENVGDNDTDVKLTATRTLLADICQPQGASLQALITSALEQASVETVNAIEVVGGGCRIPMMQDIILQSVANVEALSRSLDDTSMALGAALAPHVEPATQALLVTASNASTVVDTDLAALLTKGEQEMAQKDQDIAARADALNKLESHVLEMRSAKHGTFGKLLPDTLDDYLTQLDDWMFSEQADALSGEEMKQKLQDTINETKEMCQAYFAAVQKEKDDKERVMEEEAAKAALERGQEDPDDDDHDNRRLPKKRRMEIVLKNKAEANELFSDGNYQFAAARYTKALTHCAKFVDLSPEDVEEVNSVKLSLNLNLALAYLKLNKPDQALRVCNDALSIDPDSSKALYRRASVYYEKKNWDGARKDVEKAASLAPDDKAVKKLAERVDAQIKRQKQKEKKMAQKMFG